MQITSANCGDMLCLYHSGKRIRILDVDERTVTYLQETGDRYATFEHSVDAFVDKDPARAALFDENSRLGAALFAAESKALKTMLSNPSISAAERHEAQQVLDTVSQQREFMSKRMARERAAETPGRELASAFLSELYERGTGSHDTFWGHRVENINQMSGTFAIDGQRCDYSDAEARLSQIRFKEPHKGLDAQISDANQRRKTTSGARNPTASLDQAER